MSELLMLTCPHCKTSVHLKTYAVYDILSFSPPKTEKPVARVCAICEAKITHAKDLQTYKGKPVCALCVESIRNKDWERNYR